VWVAYSVCVCVSACACEVFPGCNVRHYECNDGVMVISAILAGLEVALHADVLLWFVCFCAFSVFGQACVDNGQAAPSADPLVEGKPCPRKLTPGTQHHTPGTRQHPKAHCLHAKGNGKATQPAQREPDHAHVETHGHGGKTTTGATDPEMPSTP
jgi:hypothetical protein